MGKKIILIGIVSLGVGIAYLLFDQSRIITYEDFITDLIGENAEVIELSIYNRLDIQKRMFHTTIEDPELINKLIHEPSMKLKKDLKKSVTPPSPLHNILFIKTNGPNSVSRSLYFNERYIHDVTRGHHIISDETLFYLIKDENLEWIEIGKDGG